MPLRSEAPRDVSSLAAGYRGLLRERAVWRALAVAVGLQAAARNVLTLGLGTGDTGRLRWARAEARNVSHRPQAVGRLLQCADAGRLPQQLVARQPVRCGKCRVWEALGVGSVGGIPEPAEESHDPDDVSYPREECRRINNK